MQRHLNAPVATSPILRGALCALVASLMMALMGGAVRMASTEIPNEMVVFLRNAFGLLTLWPWIRRVGLSGLATDQWPGHLLRSLTGLSAMYSGFYAIALRCCSISPPRSGDHRLGKLVPPPYSLHFRTRWSIM